LEESLPLESNLWSDAILHPTCAKASKFTKKFQKKEG
jgi:hypothetical protein